MNDDVRVSIDGRKETNREYMRMKILYGGNDERTQRVKVGYLQRTKLR